MFCFVARQHYILRQDHQLVYIIINLTKKKKKKKTTRVKHG